MPSYLISKTFSVLKNNFLRHLRGGFRNDMKVNCEREHGIDIYTLKDKQAVEVEALCHEVNSIVFDKIHGGQ